MPTKSQIAGAIFQEIIVSGKTPRHPYENHALLYYRNQQKAAEAYLNNVVHHAIGRASLQTPGWDKSPGPYMEQKNYSRKQTELIFAQIAAGFEGVKASVNYHKAGLTPEVFEQAQGKLLSKERE